MLYWSLFLSSLFALVCNFRLIRGYCKEHEQNIDRRWWGLWPKACIIPTMNCQGMSNLNWNICKAHKASKQPCGAWSYALCVQDKINSILISLRPKPNLSMWIQIYKRHKKEVNNCQGMLVEAMWRDGLCSQERIDGMFTSDSLLFLFIFMLFFVHRLG